MSGRLLDTNPAIAFQVGNAALLRVLAGTTVILPAVVVGELYYGAYKSGRVEANINTVDEFADANTVLDCDKTTAKYYGQIKQQLRSKGRPIPENDLWIAALAQQHGFTLVTRDEHFKQVDGLSLEAW